MMESVEGLRLTAASSSETFCGTISWTHLVKRSDLTQICH